MVCMEGAVCIKGIMASSSMRMDEVGSVVGNGMGMTPVGCMIQELNPVVAQPSRGPD